MAVELVGKRCLCVSGGERLELAGISRWSWRAGVIRACDSPALTVCMHWDGEQSAERKWRRLREECEVVLLEQELVWAYKRTGTNSSSSSQEKRRLQPALRFRPLIGQSCVGGWTVVEFISDRQLEFYTEQEELQPFEDEVDGGNPAVRDDPSLQEQVQAWLKQNQFQNILQQGACSLKGLRVKVFRLESKAQWLSGVITHHDQNNRTVTVITDQVREMNVDPSLVQMMLLDDITHSSLMGDKSKRKSHITKVNRIFLVSIDINFGICVHILIAGQNCPQKYGKYDKLYCSRNTSKSKNSNGERKRRKEDEEKDDKQRNRCGLKRLKAGSVSDLSENSDSENSSCRVQDSSSDSGSKRQLKQHYTSKRPLDCEVHPSHRGGEPSANQLGDSKTQNMGKTSPSDSPSASCNGAFRNTDAPESGALVSGGKSEEKGDGGMTEIEDRSEGASREDSEAVSALLASQESEQLVSMEATCVLLHASPLECEGAEAEHEMSTNDPEVKGSEFTHAEPRGSEFNQSEVRRSEFPHSEASSDNAVPVEEEPRGLPPCSPVIPCNKEEDVDSKQSCSPATVNAEYGPVTSLDATHKPSVHTSPCSSPEIISKPQTVRETSRQKQSASLEIGLLKNTPSPTPNRSRTPTHSPSRMPNRTPTPDKSTRSPLIVDRKEPFTIYRDPALFRTELEAHPTYIQPPHTPPNPKHHLKTPSPSSSSPSLTPASSHSKLLSPSPHPAHLSPIPLHSQPPLSLGLPHHPFALPGNPSLLGQTSGAAPLAPLGLYPLLWPPFPNGAHSYPGLGLQASKWTNPDGAGISDSSVRSNTPSPWISQPTAVTNADGQGLQPPLPIRPSSADPQRVSRNTQHCTPSSKTTEHTDKLSSTFVPDVFVSRELDRRAVTESTLIHTHLKSEQERLRTAASKNGQTYCPVALESSPRRTKQPLVVYDLTGERPNRYQEENRRILQESSEVAPFTAKLGSDREPRYPRNPTSAKEREREMDRDREGERERDVHAFRHILPPRPRSAHPTPTLTSSSYFASLSNSVENKPPQRRVPASKELYERLSASNTPVLTSSSSQVSMRARPPPLVKRHHEKEEGLLGKISEQLAHKASSMEAVEVAAVERRGPGSSLISSSPRNVPLLHRAPIFHPPAPTIVVSKDSGHGKLSPPTLTPIQPMSLPGIAQKQQRPPTLLPELKHVALDGKRLVPEKATMPLQAYDTQWGGVMYGREKVGGGHTTNGGVVKPQSATASVIVRPTNHTHTTISYTVMSNPHSKESGVQHKRGVLWTPLDTVHPINMTAQKGDLSAPINMTTKPINTAQPLTNMNVPRSRIDLIAEHCKRRETGAVQPKMESSTTSCCTSRDFPHLKKHRAGLAIAESRHNTHIIQCGSCTTLTTHPVCLLTNELAPASAVTNQSQSGQNNYHKLKKAWLTRHSEQDRVTVGKKSSLEEVKPVLDRNGKLEGKEPFVEDKKSFEKRSTLVHMKPEREKRGEKRPLESSGDSESGGDSGNESESGGSGRRFKRQPKSSFKIKQNDLQKKKVEEEEEEEEEKAKPNGTLQSAKDKPQQRLANSNGIPRSVLKDWRKVRKLKQTGEAFLQDDSCAEIGPNVQKCRECRLDRSRKSQEPAISPVFCRFYYFRRLSYSKNGVIRVNGFSVSEQTDEEAVTVWTGSSKDEEDKKMRKMDLETSKSILALIGDQFCQLIKTEDTAFTWVKKDTQIMWKRAVRGVREMCDACEATLFNMHWACHKCGFVVCMDCYKAREKKKAKDKELYVWVRCVKNQPHDFKNLMPTQIVPETALTDMQRSVHSVREKFGIPSHCSCTDSKTHNPSTATTNGLSPVRCQLHNMYWLIYVLASLEFHFAFTDLKSRQIPDQQKNSHVTVKAHTEKRAHSRKSTSPEQGSTLRDLLTSTAGKLRLGATGGAFAPVYNLSEQVTQKTRVPNILDDIIASVVENKIPATKMARVGLNQDSLPEGEAGQRPEGVKLDESLLADHHTIVPHDWLGNHRLLWLKDHLHQGNQRLFKENWTQEQPVLVSGLHKSLNANLWKPEHFSREFSSLHSDLYNCRDGSVTNSKVKEFWDGFEDVSKRPKSDKGESVVYRLKDWPSGEEFLALMPARYHDVMKSLPVPEYTDPEAHLNLASHLPSFFIRPDLGPRLCCAHGVTTCPEQDFGTSNLHVEISDTMSILVYVGVAKGNGASSKAGVLKLLEGEVLDESVKKRLKDPNETPGALWHIYMSKDLQKIQEFLQKADSDSEWDGDSDLLREGGWYLSPRLRQRLKDEYGIESRTLLQFHGDAVIIPAGALHQVMNLHSCIQVNVDFVSPEHAHNSYYLTQELRPLKDQMNYEDKLQVKNIFYHSVKDAVATLRNHLKEKNTDDVKQEES
uniref:JmjC domain-containing protein n=1 Tax=Cyprinus carpio TaxID=7962 RepID=A0A8C1G1E1_CYPCA